MMNFTESRVEQAGGIVLGVFSLALYFLIIPAEITDTRGFGVSPRFLPEMTAIFLLILAFCLFLNGYRKRRQENQKLYTIGQTELKLVVKSLLLIVFYIIAFDLLGYMIPTIAALGLFMYMYGQRKLKHLVAISLGFPLAVYLFFTKVLQMPLP